MAVSLDVNDLDETETEDELTELFFKATDHVQNTLVPNGTLNQTQLLKIYSYYKQATCGSCNVPKPRWFEMQAKTKWSAWNDLGDMDANEAKKNYIRIVSELDNEFIQNSKSKSKWDCWVSVSCPQRNVDPIPESEQTVFDHVKDGNLNKLIEMVNVSNVDVNHTRDEQGLALIHWASDRGSIHILKYLIELQADVNLLDNDGQTPLHYAASCDHVDCVRVLVEARADVRIQSSDGLVPAELTTHPDILQLLTTSSN